MNIKIGPPNKPGFLRDEAASQREGRRKLSWAPGKYILSEYAAMVGRGLSALKHLQRDRAGEMKSCERPCAEMRLPKASKQAVKLQDRALELPDIWLISSGLGAGIV